MPKKKIDNQNSQPLSYSLLSLPPDYHYLLQCDISQCVFIIYSKNFGMLKVGLQNPFFISFLIVFGTCGGNIVCWWVQTRETKKLQQTKQRKLEEPRCQLEVTK